MAEQTGIQWTDHTFNPVSGCTKISPGCAHCYAADLPPAMRRHAEWGDAPRVFASETYWAQLRAWHRKAKEAGVMRRVFCASVADIFEGEPGDREGQDGPRADYLSMLDRLFGMIMATPWLEYQLLTKRPWNAARWWAESAMYGRQWPANALIGCTAENQEQANRRIPWLFRIPARRFVSFEPLLGPIDLSEACPGQVIDWAIVGGESGRKARPMHPNWARSLRDQCKSAGVAFFFKQWGEWGPVNRGPGDDIAPFPQGTRAGMFTYDGAWVDGGANPFRQSMACLGKHVTGRLLDGREWSEFPEEVACSR